jgi:hypothetical protein
VTADRPLLRAVADGGEVPSKWATVPIGVWDGRESEVVYDPRRHDVMVVQAAVTEDWEGDLAASGWAYEGTDGRSVMWVRDRVTATRAALDRSPDPTPPDVGELGR